MMNVTGSSLTGRYPSECTAVDNRSITERTTSLVSLLETAEGRTRDLLARVTGDRSGDQIKSPGTSIPQPPMSLPYSVAECERISNRIHDMLSQMESAL